MVGLPLLEVIGSTRFERLELLPLYGQREGIFQVLNNSALAVILSGPLPSLTVSGGFLAGDR